MGKILNFEDTMLSSCDIESVEDLGLLIAEMKSSKLEKNFSLRVTLPCYDDESLVIIKQVVEVAKQKGCKAEVVINSKEMQFTIPEIERFITLEDEFQKNEVGLAFDGGLEKYSLTETLSAQIQIDEVINRINETNASPFEKYLMAYDYITSKVYKENSLQTSKSRDLIALFNGEDIVCVGYARLMQRICKGIGIECHCQSSSVYDEKGEYRGGHQNNLVYLKDEKYGIDGYYYSDACWDSVDKLGQYKRSLKYCLIPLSDKNKFKKAKVDISSYQEIDDVEIKYFYEEVPELHEFAKQLSLGLVRSKFSDESNAANDYAESLIIDNNKRLMACEVLLDLLKLEEIPPNVYGDDEGKFKYLPHECSYEYMLALLMEEPANIQKTEECVKILKDYSTNPEKYKSPKHETQIRITADVYRTIDELARSENEKRYEYRAREGVKVKSPFAWRNVCSHLSDFAMTEFMTLKIQNKVKPGTPISLGSFKQAIKNSLILQGYDEKTAEYQAELAIEVSVTGSEKVYVDSAENVFRRTALERRKQAGALGE